MSDWDAVFAPFAATYADRGHAGLDFVGRRVGCIGGDVPLELIDACGWAPVRLAGVPGLPAPDGDRFLGGGADADLRTLFQQLIDGGFGTLDRLVIAHDIEAQPRLFYALDEFRRRWPERAKALPDMHFVDILHLPRPSTARYNRRRLAQLRDWLGGCDDDRLRDAITGRNAVRRRLLHLRAHRHAGRVRGSEALAILGASLLTPPYRAIPLLDALLDAAHDRPSLPGRRTFLTGSAHDHPDAYLAIEDAGLLIVGEDHDWGDRGNEAPVDEGGDPLDALVARYRHGPPASAKFAIRDRAAYTAARVRESAAELVLCFIREHDPAPRWDVPDQNAAVAPLPFVLIDDQPWTIDPDRLRDLVQAQREGGLP